MADRFTISGLDYSGEGTSMGGYLTTLSAANFDAQVALIQAIQTAIQAVSLIDFEGLQINHVDSPRETDRPSSPYAQREAKWLVTMSDDTTADLIQFEIGGPDLTLLGSDGSTMDVSAGAGLALVGALESGFKSKAGNTCTFVSAVHVGRNT